MDHALEKRALDLREDVKTLFNWSEATKRREVSAAEGGLEVFLEQEGFSSEIKQCLLDRYETNIEEFREGVYGIVHDEFHTAKVVDWIPETFEGRREKGAIRSDKERVLKLALVISAIEHDVGDIPEAGQSLVESQRSEGKSSDRAEVFVRENAGIWGEDIDELSALVGILIPSTYPPLDMFLTDDGSTMEDLPITRILNRDSGFKTDDPKAIAMKERIEANAWLLKERFGWKTEDMIEAVRIMDTADYTSYFSESAFVVECNGLWAETQEIYVDRVGTLRCNGEACVSNLDWLLNGFHNTFHRLYKDHIPHEALTKSFNYKNSLSEKLIKARMVEKEDRALRLEGALCPANLFEIGREMDLNDNAEVKAELIAYSRNFMSILDSVNVGDFSHLATSAIRAMYLSLEGDRRREFIGMLLDNVEMIMESENSSGDLHLAPFAYGDEFLADFQAVVASRESKRIKRYAFTLRLDQSDLDKVEEIELAENEYIALGGRSNSELLKQGLDFFDDEPDKEVMVHVGLGGEKDFPQSLDTALMAMKSGRKISLHLDSNYSGFIGWFDKLSLADQKLFTDRNVLFVSPLLNVIADLKNHDLFNQLVERVHSVGLTSNNPALLMGMGLSLQWLFADVRSRKSLNID